MVTVILEKIRSQVRRGFPTDLRNLLEVLFGDAPPLGDCSRADLTALSNPRIHAATFHQFFKDAVSHMTWLAMLSKTDKQIKHAMLIEVATTESMTSTPQTTKRLIDPRAVIIGQRIRTKRELLGFTTEELGAMIGVTRNAVTQYETGRATPKPKRFEALAVALGTTTTWLLTGNEPDELARAQTKTELEALQMLRSLPLDRQQVVLEMLRGLADAKSKK